MHVCPECGATRPEPGPCAADGHATLPIGDDLLLGTQVGAYRVARLLGVGGMGRVYKGVHPQIGSRVAIKVLSRECSDRKDLVERFFSEARSVNLIRHESIVNVLDLNSLPDGRPYIIMEFLDGAPLGDLAGDGRGQAPIGSVARIVVEVLDALAAAHATGIVHRDLKPDNIFVSPAGRPKVLDFGIAKLLPELGGQFTQSGSLLGTPHYMSPEQATGKTVDSRTDIYAVGVILFECLLGRKPFVGESLFELLRQHVEAAPASPRALRPDISPELEQVILVALAKAPDQRFATAGAMMAALQAATANLPPAQWAPLVNKSGAQVRGPSGGGWGSGASWGSGAGGPSGPHAPQAGNPIPSTVSAGQITASRSSGKGLWIALAAIVLIGGGVTAAVLASGDAPGASQVAAAGSSSPSAANGNGAPAAGSAGPAAGSAGNVAAGSATGSAGSGTGSAGSSALVGAGSAAGSGAAAGAGSAAIAESDDGGGDDDVPDISGDALAAFQQSLDALRATGVSPAKLAKVEALFAKLKKSKGAARDAAITEFGDALAALAASVGDTAPPPPTPPAPPPPPPSSPGPTGNAGAWVAGGPLARPPGFNPAHVDVDALVPYALAEARKLVPDAVLFRIDADGVYADGHADLKTDGGTIDFRFQSPSRSRRDPGLPLGREQKWACMFRIMITAGGIEARAMDGWECKEPNLGPPKCSFKGAWQRAIKAGAPTAPALGELGYRGWDNKARWYFNVKGTFDTMFPDGGC